MAYLGLTLGGLFLLSLISQIPYRTVFRNKGWKDRCKFSVAVAYVLASLVYGYNESKWGVSYIDGVFQGFIDYFGAALLCLFGYLFISRKLLKANP